MGQICHLKDVCAKYSRVRQECAVAGDFYHCEDIKMKDDFRFINQCTDEGTLKDNSEYFPNAVECFSWSLAAPR
jgi:hypothetical protein